MPEEKQIVGHIVNIIRSTGLVEIEQPEGDSWETYTFPLELIEGHVVIEPENYVAIEVRDHGNFAIARARALTEDEEEKLDRRMEIADQRIEETLKKLEGSEIFEPIDHDQL